MNICVYGAASTLVDPEYIAQTEALGALIARRGHALVFGGGNGGMMGAAARGAHSEGGKIIGIAPAFFNEYKIFFEHCTEFISTETMRERKDLLEKNADAFIISPGGIGTFDEFFEILTLRSLGRHQKAIAVLNIGGYYDALENLLATAVKGKFMTQEAKDLCRFVTTPEEAIDYLESYVPQEFSVEDAKNIGAKKPTPPGLRNN